MYNWVHSKDYFKYHKLHYCVHGPCRYVEGGRRVLEIGSQGVMAFVYSAAAFLHLLI